MRIFLTLFFFVLPLPIHLYAKPLEIIFWHSAAGSPGHQVNKLVKQFNKSQDDYIIKPVYKGAYLDSLTSFTAAFRANKPPDMIQVYEVGTPLMSQSKGVIIPVNELFNEHDNLEIGKFYPAILEYYGFENKLIAMPFNVSIPVIYYNQDLLEKLNQDRFPATYDELEVLLKKINEYGYKCGYTTAYPAWIMIEAFSKTHGLQLINTQDNSVSYNNPAIIKHLERLLRWQKKNYFEYGGRNDDATLLFTSNRCPIFTHSSGSYFSLKNTVNFKLGVAPLPRENKDVKEIYSNTIGGAAIWVVDNKNPEIYKGITQFFKFFMKPDIQNLWHKNTGYLPLRGQISGKFDNSGYEFESDKSHRHQIIVNIATQELQVKNSPLNQQGGYKMHNQIREINDEALEAIFSQIKSVRVAISDAQKRADYALKRFRRNTQQIEK